MENGNLKLPPRRAPAPYVCRRTMEPPYIFGYYGIPVHLGPTYICPYKEEAPRNDRPATSPSRPPCSRHACEYECLLSLGIRFAS